MDKFEFIGVITDIFAELKTKEEIDFRAEELIKIILSQKELSKLYLGAGILKYCGNCGQKIDMNSIK